MYVLILCVCMSLYVTFKCISCSCALSPIRHHLLGCLFRDSCYWLVAIVGIHVYMFLPKSRSHLNDWFALMFLVFPLVLMGKQDSFLYVWAWSIGPFGVGSEYWIQACFIRPFAPGVWACWFYMKIKAGEGPDVLLGYFLFVIGLVIIPFGL